MKSLLLLCVLLLCLALSVAANQREVRSYTNEMEYVDHVDNPVLGNEADAASAAESHSMMETESAQEDEHDSEHVYSLMSDSEAESEEEFGLDSLDTQFVELNNNDDINTDAIRAMALEINDHAQQALDLESEFDMLIEQEADAELQAEADMDAEAEAETETEAEAETELAADLEAEVAADTELSVEAGSDLAAALDAVAEAEMEAEADPVGLTPEEIAQEKADLAAEKKDAAAELADKKDEKKDVTAAKIDAAMNVTTSIAAAANVTVPVANATVVQLPPDLSAEHAQTLSVNTAATRTVEGALGDVASILRAKDETIRSLVANVTYLTTNIGKLANKVDFQKSYISMLHNKLQLANIKNKELHDHVQHSADTVVSIRGQLKAVEDRLNKQDKTTDLLSQFLTQNQDKVELPPYLDDLTITGPRTVKPIRRVQRMIAASNTRLRPVEGTVTFASTHPAPIVVAEASVPAPPAIFQSAYFTDPAITPFSQPTFEPGFERIPTIIVEREDNGA